jgi:hypothetical protein
MLKVQGREGYGGRERERQDGLLEWTGEESEGGRESGEIELSDLM